MIQYMLYNVIAVLILEQLFRISVDLVQDS